MNRVIDPDEETPDLEALREAQQKYETFLKELDRWQIAKEQGAEVKEELELVEDDIRDTRSYLKVELEYLDSQNFLIGEYNSEHSEAAQEIYRPRVESVKRRFESAEEYYEDLRNRF